VDCLLSTAAGSEHSQSSRETMWAETGKTAGVRMLKHLELISHCCMLTISDTGAAAFSVCPDGFQSCILVPSLLSIAPLLPFRMGIMGMLTLCHCIFFNKLN
jgi:hypothetical protein